MMQHYQTDEFSVTDIRHTLNEAWRVICTRRWFLVFPFCIVTTLACAGSLLIPREYELRTVLKREHDPIFAKMMGQAWTEPYDDIRRRMKSEILDPGFLEGVLEDGQASSPRPRFDDGEGRRGGAPNALPAENGPPTGASAWRRGNAPPLEGRLRPDSSPYGPPTPASRRARQAVVNEILAGLTVETTEATPHRDIVEIRLKTQQPTSRADVLRRIRDSYVRQSRTRTAAILAKVEQFLLNESQRCREKLNEERRRLVEYELKHPGIDPAIPDPSSAEMTALTIEKVDLERRLDNAELDRKRWEAELSHLVGQDEVAADKRADVMLEEPNPRYAQYLEEIDELEKKITEGVSARMMTESHPEILRNRALLADRRAALESMPRTLKVSAKVAGTRAAVLESTEQLKRKLADNAAGVAVMRRRHADIEDRLGQIGLQRAAALQHREAYLKIKGDAEQLASELRDWQKSITPIEQVLHLEDKNHSIHFVTVEDVAADTAPVSPDPRLVLLICLGMGAAAAVLAVLMVELLDRSYRSAKQVAASLGVPVIESIDEIITRAMHRRRLFRRLVIMPILAGVSLTAVVTAGAAAYARLRTPAELDWDAARPTENPLSIAMDNEE